MEKRTMSLGWRRFLGVFPVLFLWGCLQDPVAVSDGRSLEVELRITGGFAGAEYSVFLDGGTGVLRGLSCINLCDFQAGDILQTLTEEQVDYVWNLFHGARIRSLDGEDFGTLCCDFFYADLDYRDDRGRSAVRGTVASFPDSLRLAVATLQAMASGTPPIIVAFDTPTSSWTRDPFQISDAVVAGHTLQIQLAYGGGCRAHDVQVVAWGGWMESNPVQVKLLISHNDFDDPCDAWITREVSVDLTPLRSAYRESYGTSGAGETTLVLLLEDPLMAGPLGARWLEYVF